MSFMTKAIWTQKMVSPASGSESSDPFEQLHSEIRRWIWENKWSELRDIQAKAINAVLTGNRDLILAAATAAGKTEAAFLPALTAISERNEPGFAVLYISPLKALINDQFRRLDELCERLEIPVTKWHGDASAAAKARARKDPRGVVLITPESIEALFVRRGPEVRRLFGNLAFVIIDELHAFIGNDRGTHVAALLCRIEARAGRAIRVIGLSATIGDFSAARRFIRPGAPESVEVLEDESGQTELRLQIRAVREPPENAAQSDHSTEHPKDEPASPASVQIAEHLFGVLRGSNNLVFAPSRKLVETLADKLRARSDEHLVPNEFFPHHGSLSKSLREELEARLQVGNLPTTAVATTTLELGIDIGSVRSVAQVGAPASIASMRQRLGRSGRRAGDPSILRIYVTEPDERERLDPFSALRPELVQAVASVRLLVSKWLEPADTRENDLSTLLHQVLSVIVERGGIKAQPLYSLLHSADPFAWVTPKEFELLLRGMAATEPPLIEQATDGTLMLGPLGEQLTGRYDFYAVFRTDEEYRIVTAERTLGAIPIDQPLQPRDYLIFAGRRWIVEAIDDRAKVVAVKPAPAGRVPQFPPGEGFPLHNRLVAEMREVYRSLDRPTYLNDDAIDLLTEGRIAYQDMHLDRTSVIEQGDDTYLFLWRGTRTRDTMALALAAADVRSHAHPLGLELPRCSADKLYDLLEGLAKEAPEPHTLAEQTETLIKRKYDPLIPIPLLRAALAESWIDAAGVTKAAKLISDSRLDAGFAKSEKS